MARYSIASPLLVALCAMIASRPVSANGMLEPTAGTTEYHALRFSHREPVPVSKINQGDFHIHYDEAKDMIETKAGYPAEAKKTSTEEKDATSEKKDADEAKKHEEAEKEGNAKEQKEEAAAQHRQTD